MSAGRLFAIAAALAILAPPGALAANDVAVWEELVRQTPGPRASASMLYDPRREKVVLFGYYDSDIWEWDAGTMKWDLRPVTGEMPTKTLTGGFAYDPGRDRYVYFGGGGFGWMPSAELWEFDPAAGAWSQPSVVGDKPGDRNGALLVHDPNRGKMVMVGRSNPGEIWEWDGAARTWSNRTPASGVPPKGVWYGLVYDLRRQKIILAGGVVPQPVWEWDGAAGSWTERPMTAATVGLTSAVAYDAFSGRVLFFLRTGEVVEGDPVTGAMTQRTPATGTVPSNRESNGVAFDSRRRRYVIYSGLSYSGGAPGQDTSGEDTWEWDPATNRWTEVSPARPSPGRRDQAAMAYDTARRRVVLFGGSTRESPLSTWEWDSATRAWTDVPVTMFRPPQTSQHSMVYDAGRARTVLFGGRGESPTADDLLEYDAASMSWMNRTPPAGVAPTARPAIAMAYDSDRQRVFVYDGSSTLWEWDGGGGRWLPHAFSSPPLGTGGSLVYDRARRRLVYLQGLGPSGVSAWDWDAGAPRWVERPAVAAPPARSSARAAYDADRRRLLLFGGQVPAGSRLRDLWEWEGESGVWTERPPEGRAPAPRSGHTMVFDEARSSMIVFGGASGGGYMGGGTYSDVWELVVTKLSNGSSCPSGVGARCQSGHCVEGVCCPSPAACPRVAPPDAGVSPDAAAVPPVVDAAADRSATPPDVLTARDAALDLSPGAAEVAPAGADGGAADAPAAVEHDAGVDGEPPPATAAGGRGLYGGPACHHMGGPWPGSSGPGGGLWLLVLGAAIARLVQPRRRRGHRETRQEIRVSLRVSPR